MTGAVVSVRPTPERAGALVVSCSRCKGSLIVGASVPAAVVILFAEGHALECEGHEGAA